MLSAVFVCWTFGVNAGICTISHSTLCFLLWRHEPCWHGTIESGVAVVIIRWWLLPNTSQSFVTSSPNTLAVPNFERHRVIYCISTPDGFQHWHCECGLILSFCSRASAQNLGDGRAGPGLLNDFSGLQLTCTKPGLSQTAPCCRTPAYCHRCWQF